MRSLRTATRLAWWLTWIQLAAGCWLVTWLTPDSCRDDYVFLAIVVGMGLVPALPGVYLAWRTRRRERTWLLLLEASALYAAWHVTAVGSAAGWWHPDLRQAVAMPGPVAVTIAYQVLMAAGFLAVCGLILASPKPKLILPEPVDHLGPHGTRSTLGASGQGRGRSRRVRR